MLIVKIKIRSKAGLSPILSSAGHSSAAATHFLPDPLAFSPKILCGTPPFRGAPRSFSPLFAGKLGTRIKAWCAVMALINKKLTTIKAHRPLIPTTKVAKKHEPAKLFRFYFQYFLAEFQQLQYLINTARVVKPHPTLVGTVRHRTATTRPVAAEHHLHVGLRPTPQRPHSNLAATRHRPHIGHTIRKQDVSRAPSHQAANRPSPLIIRKLCLSLPCKIRTAASCRRPCCAVTVLLISRLSRQAGPFSVSRKACEAAA